MTNAIPILAALALLASVGRGQPAGPNKLTVPDYVRPGARFIYELTQTLEPTRPNDPSRPGGVQTNTGQGPVCHDVVAVTDMHVLARVSTWLPARGGGGYTFMGASAGMVDATQANAGTAIWIPKDALALLAADASYTVSSGPWEQNGQRYDATVLARIGDEDAVQMVFENGTGLMLSTMRGVGRPRREGDPTGYNRQSQSRQTFIARRQLALPWADAAPPAWSNTVRRMTYRGRQVMTQVNGPAMTTPLALAVEFTRRGEGWAGGTVTTKFGNPQMPDAFGGIMGGDAIAGDGPPPQSQPFHTGRAVHGGYWIGPDALAAMKPGVIDRDPTLGTTLSYAVQDGPAGLAGVLTETSDVGSFQSIAAYRLDDGALVYSSLRLAEMNLQVELELAGRE